MNSYAKFIRLLVVTLPTLAFTVLAETRTFTSKDGVTIEAAILEVSVSNKVTLKRSDGHVFKDVPLDFFSIKDQTYIYDWKKMNAEKLDDADITADTRMRLIVLLGKDNVEDDEGNKFQVFNPKVSFFNEDYKKSFQDIEASLILIGRHSQKTKYYSVIHRNNFTVNVRKREKIDWHGKKFTLPQNEKKKSFDYEGYVVVVWNKEGEVVLSKASKNTWDRVIPAITEARTGTLYEKDFVTEEKKDF